jgi:hypothetical protein
MKVYITHDEIYRILRQITYQDVFAGVQNLPLLQESYICPSQLIPRRATYSQV